MKIYGLVGKSGTGKSYQSMNVCRDRKIEGIIDDGLFIYDNAVQAGHSAKRDENKMTAIKTAIFYDKQKRAEVADKIKEISPASILVLGTSEEMIHKICRHLELPEVSEMIRIEDIVDEDAITTALRQRREKGKHVIPVPTFEIKRQFSGYFMTPLKVFRRKNNKLLQSGEKSVVRPTYSYLGEFVIADRAVMDIVEYAAMISDGVYEVIKCSIKSSEEGVVVTMVVVLEYGHGLWTNIEQLQRRVAEEVERITAFNILSVNVVVKGLKPLQ